MKEIIDKVRHYVLYPEFVIRKNLSSVLKKEFTKNLSTFNFKDKDGEIHESTYSFRISKNNKASLIHIAKLRRLFMADFWRNGVLLAHIKSCKKSKVAKCVCDWIENDYSIDEFRRKYPYIKLEEYAYVYENYEEIEYAWKRYSSKNFQYYKELGDFIEKALLNEKLKNLFPFMSMDRLFFSRCTGYPYTYDCPYVVGRDGLIYVFSCKGDLLSKCNVDQAINLVVKNLPPNCMRAISGTADNL